MKLDTVRPLRGPNLWSDRSALDAVLLVPLERAGALRDRLLGWFAPATSDTSGSDGGLRAAEALAALALDLQVRAGVPVSFFRALRLASPGEYRIVVEYHEEAVGLRALELALELANKAPEDGAVDLGAELEALRESYADLRLGPSTGAIVKAAAARGIPARRLTEGSLIQLGFGARQRRIWASETDKTSAIAEAIAQDKELTKSLLHAVGIPVPEGVVASSREHAWSAAQAIGLPVVVKPRKGNQGKGVSVNLQTQEAVLTAFDIAVKYDGQTVIERYVEGDDYRLLVVGGKLVAAAHREPPLVVGDGTRSIRELVELENLNPLRGNNHATALSKLLLDAVALETLADRGLDAESVLAAGQVVHLRRNANLSTGGTASDVTAQVHPEVAERAIEAAKMVGLDIAGVDIVAPRLDQPLETTRGAIVEVNAAPGLRMHLEPSRGVAQPVGEAVIASMFTQDDDARIPIVAVTGTNGKTTTTRCIAHLLAINGLRVGMTCTDGIYVEGRRIDTGDCSGPKSARAVLAHPDVDAAVLETARGGILREGLGFDWCDVAVVTNVGEGDHLGLGGIDSPEALAAVKAVPVRQVSSRGAAVLNADDPLVVAMAKLCRGTVIYFSRNPLAPALAAHRASGGLAVMVRGGHVIVARGQQETRIAAVEDLPLTLGGRVGFQMENLLAAVAAGYWLGLRTDTLRQGIRTFTNTLGSIPGRFNVLNHRGSTIILDYGHNASALLALVDALEAFPHRRRKIVYTAAGDRRDSDITRQAQIIGATFDEVYIYEDQCTRGRQPGEILQLMRAAFSSAPRARRILQAKGELLAIGAAVSSLSPGDLLLCQVDQVDLALEFVSTMLRKAEARPIASIAAEFASAAMVVLSSIRGWEP